MLRKFEIIANKKRYQMCLIYNCSNNRAYREIIVSDTAIIDPFTQKKERPSQTDEKNR